MASLYHYTDFSGASGILRSGLVRISTGPSADGGTGVYLTGISPDAGQARILWNNYGGEAEEKVRQVKIEEKAEFYFKFQLGSLPAVKKLDSSGRDVWLYPGDIHLERTPFHCGRTGGSQDSLPRHAVLNAETSSGYYETDSDE